MHCVRVTCVHVYFQYLHIFIEFVLNYVTNDTFKLFEYFLYKQSVEKIKNVKQYVVNLQQLNDMK